MPLCYECGQSMGNRHYGVSAVIRDEADRIAFSSMGVDMCQADFDRVSVDLYENPADMKSPLGFAIEIGSAGGVTYKFLDRKIGMEKLPKSAGNLFANPIWVEMSGKRWEPAEWAQELYNFFVSKIV